MRAMTQNQVVVNIKTNHKHHCEILTTTIALAIAVFFLVSAAWGADARYNEVAFACTHNAMSSAQDGWSFPHQEYNITRQLADGVRALMLDIHYDYYDSNVVVLQHGEGYWAYTFGHEPLSNELKAIKDFLDANSDEIVTIIFESYVDVFSVVQQLNSVRGPPGNVSASDGLHAKEIAVTWDACEYMVDYQVYRNTSNSSNGAARIATGVTGTQYTDTVISNQTYYYWVRAWKYGRLTGFSASNGGWCGGAAGSADGMSFSIGAFPPLLLSEKTATAMD